MIIIKLSYSEYVKEQSLSAALFSAVLKFTKRTVQYFLLSLSETNPSDSRFLSSARRLDRSPSSCLDLPVRRGGHSQGNQRGRQGQCHAEIPHSSSGKCKVNNAQTLVLMGSKDQTLLECIGNIGRPGKKKRRKSDPDFVLGKSRTRKVSRDP